MTQFRDSFPIGRLAACVPCGLLLLGVFGCPPGPKFSDKPPPAPRPLTDIIATLEANHRALDRPIWSNSVTVKAHFKDSRDEEHTYNLDSSLLFSRPMSLRMDLKPGLGDQVMQIGSNLEDYWFWVEPKLGMMRWGRHRHVGKPGTHHLAIRPDQLVAALGLGSLPSAADGFTGPAPKAGKTYDQLTYLHRRPTGGYVLREYKIDRVEPYMIRLVVFVDESGRRTMSAFLDDYRPAWEGGPLVAHHVNIEWPLNGGRFTMWIDKMRLAPPVHPRAFDRPTAEVLPAGVTDIVQVDAACDEPTSNTAPPGD